MNLSAKQFFILGMVALNPPEGAGISGTDINELIIKRNVKEWTRLSFSSVYYMLNQLEKKKLVKGRIEKNLDEKIVGAPQKLFSLTREGKIVLKKTVRDYLNRIDLNYTEFNIVLSTAHILSNRELIRHLTSFRERIEQRLNQVQNHYWESEDELPPEEMPPHVWALFNHAFYMMKAKKTFLNEFIQKLEEKEKEFENL